MLYQHALCTTVPQRIRHKDPYAAAERERLEECATQSAANHDHTGCCRKAPLYAGQSVSVINNDRTLWLPATIVRAADHGSYIIKVIGGAEYRRARDHIHERHPDVVKPDTHPKVEVAGQPITTPSTSEAVQLQQAPTAPAVQPSVAPATTKQAAAQSPTAATRMQQKAPVTTDVHPPTGRTDVAPHRSGHVSKAPQRLIEHMQISTAMMRQDEQVHPHTMDQDLKTLLIKHSFKINHLPQSFAHYHSLKVNDMQHKF